MALLVLSACGGAGEPAGSQRAGSPTSGGAAEAASVRLLLPYQPSTIFYPVHLAQALGYFQQEQLDVKVEPAQGSSFVVQQVAAGKADAGLAIPHASILGYAQNGTFRSVYQFYTANDFQLYVPSASPVGSLGDLRGKVLGVNDLAGGEALTARMLLRGAGLNPDRDVRIQVVGYSTATHLQALRSGRIDAIVANFNPLASYDVAGLQYRCISCDQQALAGTSLIVANSLWDDRKDVIGRLGRALSKATLYAHTNPAAAITIMRRVAAPEFTNQRTGEKLMGYALESTSPSPGAYGRQDPAAWANQMRLLRLAGSGLGSGLGLTKDVELSDLVRDDLVGEYNQFDQQAVIDQAKQAK